MARLHIISFGILLLPLCSTVQAQDPVQFIDPNLENAVETALGISDPTPADMLNLYQLDAMSLGITDITGIECATNLTTLDLRFNQITDVRALSGLTNLWWLGIYSNQITDLRPLSGLTRLQTLDPGSNQISDISPLSNLTELRYLDLTQNQIIDVNALSGLTNLTRLYLSDNQITDVSSLSGLNSLVALDLGRNQITDINDLSGLKALEGLWLHENQIADVSVLTGLTQLTTLWLQQNPLDNNAYCTDLATIAANNPSLTVLAYTPNSSPPTGLSASDTIYADRIRITWDLHCSGPSYTSFYQVYRSDSAAGVKSAISSWQSLTTFDDTTAVQGRTYTYWVRAATSDQGEYVTDYSESDTGSVSSGQPPQQTGAISGRKWNDVNGDGSPSGEQGLEGWTIFAEPVGSTNGQLEPNEPFATTGQDGSYTLRNLLPEKYRVCEVLQNGWVQTFPSQGYHEVDCSGSQVITDVDFGNLQTGTGQQSDWGDAPDPTYPTLKSNNGAYHVIVPGFFLGGSVDGEPDGQPTPDARGDDHYDADDEDGIFFVSPVVPNTASTIEVITAAAGRIDAWIDFEADGSWVQASNRIFNGVALVPGSNVLTFNVPVGAMTDVDTYARFRFSTQGGLSYDGPANDGEVEDYHILLGPEGPGMPGEGEVPHVKWSQPPIEIDPNVPAVPVFCGWDEPARSTERDGLKRQWRMVADDFHCLGPVPVTRIRWWGSYKAWQSPEPPELQPMAWHIGFWANMVEGLAQDQLYPERLVWALEIPAERVHLEPVGFDEFPQRLSETCFFYEVRLQPDEWFHQAEFPSAEGIFWISITAVYPADAEQINMWGWTTRPYVWRQGALMPAIMGEWPNYEERLFPGRITPIENAQLCDQNRAYDVCFELLTEPPWVKWDQPFANLRNWPHSEDRESFAMEDEDGNVQIERRATDDWLCERIGPVVAVSWHGSYIGYGYEACKCDQVTQPRRPDYFMLSLRMPTNTPASDGNLGEPVWEYRAYDYDEVLVGYDGNPEGEPNEPVFRYSVRLPEEARFLQERVNQIYWLSIVAVYRARPDKIEYPWGWTTRLHTFGSTALSVSLTDDGSVLEPLYDHTGEPMDMSFTLLTVPEQ